MVEWLGRSFYLPYSHYCPRCPYLLFDMSFMYPEQEITLTHCTYTMSISIPRASFERRSSGPYISPTAIIGGVPNPTLYVPITGFFLVFFLVAGGFHVYIHEKNKKRKHKFHLSALMLDFCLVRTITCILRIAWAFRPGSNGIVLTALIFENAGYDF